MKMRCKKARKNISLAMDSRLQPARLEQLQMHLRGCLPCREWQQEQSSIQEMFGAREVLEPSPGFYQKLQVEINSSSPKARFFFSNPAVLRPALLRAAMFLVLIFSALLGFFLGGRLDVSPTETAAAVFSQTMNLNAYADMPADSFGAVYDRLLQGELQ
jgi:predicted anti-sigma-YlaC factor YlaD